MNTQRTDSLCLLYSRSVDILLDDKTPIDWLNTSLIEKNDSIYVLIFNAYIGDFLFYDMFSGEKIGELKTDLVDFDGISVYDYHDIYIHDYEKCFFYKLNNNGKICDTLKVPFIDNQTNCPPSRISVFSGVNFIGGKFFYATFSVGESDRGNRYCGAVLNLESMENTYIVPYPEIYQKANWGGNMFRLGYTCFNPQEKLFLYSFPASHNLYVYDMVNNKTRSFYAGSNRIDMISSYSNDVDEIYDDNKSTKHYISNPSYGAIIYDKYRNLYYRIAEIPQDNGLGEYRMLKQLSIIILDQSFNIVGETCFSQPYGTTVLVSPDGLLIPFVENNDLDGVMQYHVFKICSHCCPIKI